MNFLQLLSDRPIALRPEFARAFGGIEEAIFFQQILFWSDKGNREDGWIYKTKEEIEEETTLTRRVQDRVREKLVDELGVIEAKVMAVTGTNRQVLHYKVDFTKAQTVLLQQHETYYCKSTKRTSALYTESTTESTPGEEEKNMNKMIGELIDLFKVVDPAYKRYFGNKTERKAAEQLLTTFKWEDIQKRVAYVPQYNKMPYINNYAKIYKPSDLLRNWQVMEDNIITYRNTKKSQTKEIVG